MAIENQGATRFAMSQLFAVLGVSGPDLLLREYGRRIFPILRQELLGVLEGQTLVLDFHDVSVMDTSFADETILELAIGLVAGKYGERFLLLDTPSAAVVDNLEGTIARRKAKVALLQQQGQRVLLIGHIEESLEETWSFVARHRTATARQLSDAFRLEINTSSTRLAKLYKARLLARHEEVSSAGRQHLYTIPG